MSLIAGVDEVGRGPWAGPVVAAAVILDPKRPIEGLKDSKVLTEKKREILSETIKNNCLAWSLGYATVEEIDQMNILQASLLAMQRAIEGLAIKPSQIKIDGQFLPKITYAMEAVIGGDSLVPAISAASIVAKVQRDKDMADYDQVYPNYGFGKHKGYGTALHLAALRQYGVTSIHRRSFAPVKKILDQLQCPSHFKT